MPIVAAQINSDDLIINGQVLKKNLFMPSNDFTCLIVTNNFDYLLSVEELQSIVITIKLQGF